MNFLKRIFSPVFLISSFLLLIYTFYKSEIHWDGSTRDYYSIYYLISLILIFFSIITFFINQKIKEYLIILSISIVVSLYLFETFLTFYKPPLREQLYNKQSETKWDSRSKFEIYTDLKKKDSKTTMAVAPFNYLYKDYPIFPLSGISNSKTIYCNENGYYSIYESDRYGFNNPDDEWDVGEIEYLLVGDSFAQGACVNRPNDIGSVLRTLSNKAVLNLGYGSNGPLMEYATLREYLNSNVKKILWIYYEGNDLGNLKNEIKNNILINYLNDLIFSQDLKLKQNEIDELAAREIDENSKKDETITEEQKQIIVKYKIRRFIKIYNTRALILKPAIPVSYISPKPVPEFKKILQLTKELVNQNNSKLYFVYLPEYNRFKTDYDNTNYDFVKNIIKELDINFIDINKEVFEKQENPLTLFPFKLDGHYTVEGYKKVSETLFNLTRY